MPIPLYLGGSTAGVNRIHESGVSNATSLREVEQLLHAPYDTAH